MGLRILYIGRDKKNFFDQAEKEYRKRIGRFARLEIDAIPPPKYSKSTPIPDIKKMESAIFERFIKSNERVILLDEKGKYFDSQKFARFIEQKLSHSPNIVFVFGGAYGFEDSFKEKYKEKLALSELTMAHHLARVVFLEQLFRAFSILNNDPYHNE